MFQSFLYFQQDFEKGLIYNDVREIVRIRDFIDVPHFSFFDHIPIRILYKTCKGTLMKLRMSLMFQISRFLGRSS